MFATHLRKRGNTAWVLHSYYYDTFYNYTYSGYKQASQLISSLGADAPVTFIHKHDNGTQLVTVTLLDQVEDNLKQFTSFVSGESDKSLQKRGSVSWLTMNIWGASSNAACWIPLGIKPDPQGDNWDDYNIGEIVGDYDWPELDPRISEKFFLAISSSTTRTADSAIVGEIYANAYGGYDFWDG